MAWNSYNKKQYTELGYIYTKMNDLFDIDIKDLNINSHYYVDVQCSHCKNIINSQYKHYNNSLKKNGFYVCKSCSYQATKQTNMLRYGVENVSYLDEIKKIISEKGRESFFSGKEKRDKTNLERYGCINPFQNQDIIDQNLIKCKNTKIKNGRNIADEFLSDFYIYEKNVTNLTRKNKKLLLKNWDGYDYYDGEYIKDNFNLKHTDSSYPNVDHKISIKHGFENDIEPNIIADISNLCVTKKKINVIKSGKTEEEYKNILYIQKNKN